MFRQAAGSLLRALIREQKHSSSSLYVTARSRLSSQGSQVRDRFQVASASSSRFSSTFSTSSSGSNEIPSFIQSFSAEISSPSGQTFVIGVIGLSSAALLGERLLSDSSHGEGTQHADHHGEKVHSNSYVEENHGDADEVHKATEDVPERLEGSGEAATVTDEEGSIVKEAAVSEGTSPELVAEEENLVVASEGEEGHVEQESKVVEATEENGERLSDVFVSADVTVGESTEVDEGKNSAQVGGESEVKSDEEVVGPSESVDEKVEMEGESEKVHVAAAGVGGGEGEENESAEGGSEISPSSLQAESECPFCTFMRAGPCGEEFVLWEKCVEEAEAEGGSANIAERCVEVTHALKVCMEKSPEYYGIILEAEKSMMAADESKGESGNQGDKHETEGEKELAVTADLGETVATEDIVAPREVEDPVIAKEEEIDEVVGAVIVPSENSKAEGESGDGSAAVVKEETEKTD